MLPLPPGTFYSRLRCGSNEFAQLERPSKRAQVTTLGPQHKP
jgi:hypothetical protein